MKGRDSDIGCSEKVKCVLCLVFRERGGIREMLIKITVRWQKLKSNV